MTAAELPAPLARREILISYADTDAAGIIYYAAWFPWLERLHTEWLFEHGVRFPELLDRCETTVVTRATSCEYLAVVRPYDRIEISMFLAYVGSRSYRVEYVMARAADGAKVARATLTLVGIGRDGRSAPLPSAIKELLVPAAAPAGAGARQVR